MVCIEKEYQALSRLRGRLSTRLRCTAPQRTTVLLYWPYPISHSIETYSKGTRDISSDERCGGFIVSQD